MTRLERRLFGMLVAVTAELRSELESEYGTNDDPLATKKIATTHVPEAEELIADIASMKVRKPRRTP